MTETFECIKCRVEGSAQDSRGWEQIKDIWICPQCIKGMREYQDMKDNLEKQIFKYQEYFANLNILLEDNKGVG